jgi:hypothetical protein
MLNSLRSIGSWQTPGGLMAESHVAPGLAEPLLALRIPKLFPVEPWPACFVERLVAELKAGPPMEGIVQLDSRTGWLPMALAKLGMARRILGVDALPQSQILGNFHAALHEGGGRVEFRDEAQWPSLPKDWQPNLILASPGNGYSPSPSDLDLIELRISQARERLRAGGRMIFNLRGYLGREFLENLFRAQGLEPIVREATWAMLEPSAHLSQFLRWEQQNGQSFQFFFKHDLSTPVSAHQVQHLPVAVHYQRYLIEARP